jgi:hypothetical protein
VKITKDIPSGLPDTHYAALPAREFLIFCPPTTRLSSQEFVLTSPSLWKG